MINGILFGFNVFAQSSVELLIADSIYSKALELRKLGQYENARVNYHLAKEHYKKVGALGKWRRCIGGLRIIASKRGEDISFLDSMDRYINDSTILDSSIINKLLYTKANLYDNLNLYMSAIEVYKEIIPSFLLIRDTLYAQSSYYNLSLKYSRLGDQKNSIDYITKALELVNGHSFKERFYCKYKSILGKYYYHNEDFTDSENIYIQVIDECPQYSQNFHYLIELYLSVDSLELSKKYIDKSQEIFGQNDSDYLTLLATYYKKTGLKDLSIATQYRAIDLLESYRGRRYLKELVRYAQLLDYFDEPEESFLQAHKALRTSLPEIDSLMLIRELDKDDFNIEIWLVEALYLKAKYYASRFVQDNGLIKYQDSAKFHYDLMFGLFERVTSTFNSNSSVYRLTEHARDMYDRGLNFYLDIHDSQQKEEFKEYAFQLAQESNAYVLKNAFSIRESLQFSGVPSDTINKYLFLHSQVSNDKTDTIDRLDKLQEYDVFKDYLVDKYPGWTNYQNKETPSIPQLQDKLNNDQLLIKYFYHDNDLKAFVINKNTSLTYDLELPENFDSLVNRNLELLAQSGTSTSGKVTEQAFIESSSQLYNLILKDILSSEEFKDIQHLIIVPDGPIKKISFSSLINKPTSNWEDISKYLVSDYQISYLYYCAQLLNELQKEDKDGFLGFGIEYEDSYLQQLMEELRNNYEDEDKTRSISLASLEYADEEAQTCAELYDGQYFLNQDVTPSQIKNQIEKFDMVHFSLHALVDEENYLDSYMLLNPDTSSNNKISYRDILSLNSQPSFVVLSACQTGTGSDIVGEGSMSLCRAFSQTGTDATMGSYWNTPDKSTMQIMKLFYTNLKEGMNKSEALRQAQIEYTTNDTLSSPIVRRPANWASWVIYGSVESVSNSFVFNGSAIWTMILSSCLLILLIFLFRKKSISN